MSADDPTATKKPIPFVRPSLPDPGTLWKPIQEAFASGMLTKGTHLERFERELAAHLEVEHAVCVSSCTSGLMLTYRGLDLTGEVIVPSFTFMATVGAMIWAGLRPVYVDVNPETTNVDPQAVEAAITPRTSAIVAVHNFGNPADIEALVDIARRHDLRLIFDAAHGFGTRYRGRPVGGQGDAQAFSMSPTKLVVAGEGGVVATNNSELARLLRIGREYGNDGHYDSLFAGMNARMPEISALVGSLSLARLEDVVAMRQHVASCYQQALSDLPGIGFMQVDPEDRCSYKDFSITIDAEQFGATREDVIAALRAEGIDTRCYYDPPVHRHQAYQQYVTQKTHLPNTEWLAASSLSLPIGAQIDESGIERVARVIRQAQGSAAPATAAPK